MERSYNDIEENIKRIRFEAGEAMVKYNRGPSDVRLMAVTKTVPAEIVNKAVSLGIDLLGENKAQELLSKYGEYDREHAEIHFIGHLQSNKVKQIIDKVTMIQSVDRVELAREIASRLKKSGGTMDILLEVNIGGEESKSGVKPERLEELALSIAKFEPLKIKGLMTIPPICDSILQAEQFFFRMYRLLVDMRAKNIDNVTMGILSMGMSGDYIPAIKHGANIIRLGTAIFGYRNYPF